MPKTIHFKSKEAYRKWNAYRYIHGVNEGTREKVIIKGHVHKVHHDPISKELKEHQKRGKKIYNSMG